MNKMFFVIACLLGHATVAQRNQIVVSLGLDSTAYAGIHYEMRAIEVENVEPDRPQKGPTKAVIWRKKGPKSQRTVPLGNIRLLKDDTSKTSLYGADTVTFRLYDDLHTMSSRGYLLDSKGRPIEALIIRPLKTERTERITFDQNHMTKNVRPKAHQLFLITEDVRWNSEGGFLLPGIPTIDVDAIDTDSLGAYAICVKDWWGRAYGFFEVHRSIRDDGMVKMVVYEPESRKRMHFTRDKRGHVLLDGKIRVRKIGVMRQGEKVTYKGVIRQKHHKRDRMPKPRTAKKDKIHNF